MSLTDFKQKAQNNYVLLHEMQKDKKEMKKPQNIVVKREPPKNPVFWSEIPKIEIKVDKETGKKMMVSK